MKEQPMKLEKNSVNLLAVTKSKAKMHEFSVPEEHHIELKDNPDKLLVLTLSILGELAQLTIQLNVELSEEDESKYNLLKSQLVNCAHFFDALEQSKLTLNYESYLRVVGSSSYYLSDMPGSSGLIIKDLQLGSKSLTGSGIDRFLIWLLKGNYAEPLYEIVNAFSDSITAITRYFCDYINNGNSIKELYESCEKFRLSVYSKGNDRELLFADVIYAVIIKKVLYSSSKCLPLYTGLSLNQWSVPLKKKTFIQEFWPAQRLIGESGVLSGMSAVIQMPTSAGKTKSTELIIRSSFLSGRSKLAVIVAPFRSLCREISDSLKETFDNEAVAINELLDIPQVSDTDREFIKFFHGEEALEKIPKNSVVISTPEKLVYILRHQPELANDIGLLIFDEGHQFDTGSRGVTYELLIANLRNNVNTDSQVILISAVMSNADTIGDWLYGDRGTTVHGSHCLPTHRSVAFSSWTTKRGQLKYVNQDRIDQEDFFVPRVIEQINLGKRKKEKKDRVFPDRNAQSKSSHMSAYLGIKLCSQGAVAIFCGLKSSVNTICKLIVDQYDRELPLPPPSEFSNTTELEKIKYLAIKHFGDDSEVPRAIHLGVIPHSANIPSGIRISGEYAMQNGLAILVVCTSTLAQGVNLPIKYLIVSGLYQAGEKISNRDFHNLIGRAGRSGHHTEGSVIFSSPEIFDKKKTYKGRKAWADIKSLLNFDNAEKCTSSLKSIIEPFPKIPKLDVIDYIAKRAYYREKIIDYVQKNKMDINEALFNLDFRERSIDAIESFLLANITDFNTVNPEDGYLGVVKGTLAYSMASEDEKILLKKAFETIFNDVLKVPYERRSFYGKALLGINDLDKIVGWLEDNYSWLDFDESLGGTLAYIWELVLSLCKNEKIHKYKSIKELEKDETVLTFAKNWINHMSYHELASDLINQGAGYRWGKSHRKITIDNAIELADHILGYDCMLIIGAIADVIEGIHGEVKVCRTLRDLQKAVKYGLKNPLSIWLYEKGLSDRELCKELSASLLKEGVDKDTFKINTLEQHSDLVKTIINKYPSYFSS